MPHRALGAQRRGTIEVSNNVFRIQLQALAHLGTASRGPSHRLFVLFVDPGLLFGCIATIAVWEPSLWVKKRTAAQAWNGDQW